MHLSNTVTTVGFFFGFVPTWIVLGTEITRSPFTATTVYLNRTYSSSVSSLCSWFFRLHDVLVLIILVNNNDCTYAGKTAAAIDAEQALLLCVTEFSLVCCDVLLYHEAE